MENYTKEKEVNEEKSVEFGESDRAFMAETQCLLGRANDSFQGLCKTLETEQLKLDQLEQRRIKLQEEMRNLRLEIEDEKRFFEEDLAQLNAERTEETTLPDSIDITKFNIDLKTGRKCLAFILKQKYILFYITDFMREFLAQQTREIMAEKSSKTNEILNEDKNVDAEKVNSPEPNTLETLRTDE